MALAITEYQRRRKQLMQTLGPKAAIIVPAAPERIRNNDAHYPYRQDSDLLYLTGFGEPESVLVLVPGRRQGESILFCRERDPERERWDGERLGPERAPAALGVCDAFPYSDLDDILPGLIEGRDTVHYPFGRDPEFDLRVLGWINRLRAQVRQGARPPQSIVALGHALHEQRLFKSAAELRLMQRSADIAVAAHTHLLDGVRPGLYEYQVEAELLRVFRRHRAVPAYEPIVAAGANACVLHYRANRAELEPGALLLVDAGAEYEGYASDITRTLPISGRYTPAQRALYDLVLSAQAAAIECARPGRHWNDLHEAAVRQLTAGLIRLGLLRGSLERCIRDGKYRDFYMHKTGHWLGLDVHDVGDYRIDGHSRQLEPGMVCTIEPGLYVPADYRRVDKAYRGIGIRIEDDIVITRGEPRVLTAAAPKDPEVIEARMAQRMGTSRRRPRPALQGRLFAGE
jgi:Xaa-Pro aminopeptidase